MKTRHLTALIVLAYATLLSSDPALAQFSQQGSKLVGTGAVGNADQGYSVSLSADGNTAIVGGPYDNAVSVGGGFHQGAGAAWVWTRSGDVWTQQGTKLVGSGAVGAALQGWSVSLSADGNTAIVGGIGDNTALDALGVPESAGAVWVWTRNGGVWTQQGTKLVGSDAEGYSQQGYSVSLSADGNTAIVGGELDNIGAGAAWIWSRSGGVWTQQGGKLVGSGTVGNFAEQGYSVSLSADGNTAIIGGNGDNDFAGGAWVWTRSGGVWTQQGTKLVSSGVTQGYSVSLSADGNTAIVGGPGDNSSIGAAWVWTRSGDVWTQQGTKLVGSGAVGTARQGGSVSLSADGNTAIVGADSDNSDGGFTAAGAAWVWTRSGDVWTQQGTKLVGSGAVGSAGQGFSVSLSADGNTAIAGGYLDNSNVGAAWVFAAPAAAPQPGNCPTMTSSNVYITYQGASNGCSTGQTCTANTPITFFAQSFGYGFGCATHTFSWSVNDGSPELTGRQTTHAFATAGSYTVTLTVANSQQVFQMSIAIAIGGSNMVGKRRAVAPPKSAAILVTSLGANAVAPLQQLTINGSGFDISAATQVNFSDGDGYSATVTAIVPSATTLIVAVPPYSSPATQLNGVGAVNVQVMVHTVNGGTLRSNVISGLHISALPVLTLPAGTVAANFMTFLRLSLGQVENDLLDAEDQSNGQLSFTSYREGLDNEINQLSVLETTIRSKIGELAAAPKPSQSADGVSVRVQSNQGITFDQPSLMAMDQRFLGVFQSDTTVSNAEPPKGGIECYSVLKQALKNVMTQASSPEEIIKQQFAIAKSGGECAQAEIDAAKQFGAQMSVVLLGVGPEMEAAAAEPILAVPALLGLATVGVELNMLADARDTACAANYLFPSTENRKLCVTAAEEGAKSVNDAKVGNLIELLAGKPIATIYEALDYGYELIPKDKSAVDLLESTDLWPTITGVSCSPNTIDAGETSACIITINFAPLTNTVVVLTSDDPPGILSMPPNVTIGANDSNGTFAVTGVAQGTATIKASGAQTSHTATATVTVKAVSTTCSDGNPGPCCTATWTCATPPSVLVCVPASGTLNGSCRAMAAFCEGFLNQLIGFPPNYLTCVVTHD